MFGLNYGYQTVTSLYHFMKGSEVNPLVGGDVLFLFHTVVTPHAQRERGKVIDRGVHIYIYK